MRLRARLLEATRRFFAGAGVLEVETPILGACTATDPALASLQAVVGGGASIAGRRFYLQTSPELALKRLLAAYRTPVYQLGKAFRDGERGSLHNPEFTLLEWYRPGWDHIALMGEVEALLDTLLGTGPGRRVTYRDVFLEGTGLDALRAPTAEIARAAQAHGLAVEASTASRDECLDFLFATRVQAALAGSRLVFVHDFPASQAALARIRPGDPPVAERFEAFVDGVELANGYHELSDPAEQRARCEADLARRRARGLEEPPMDERFLAALGHGLPDCAGVALGFDRLVMITAGLRRIDGVMAFPLERA